MTGPTPTWPRPEPARPPQAEIPPTKQQRQRLLRAVHNYVAARRPTPPLSASELRMHVDSIIRAGGGADEPYRKFLTVLVNNRVWRDTLAGIPFNRRLLLLPKCFRRDGRCAATFDQLGLNCRRCGHCAIDDLQSQAERLGYAVLVAEGSGVVLAMIEQAKLQAIVGVSCLSVLERVFPQMEAAAIPGVAIPLLHDGCRETTVDFDWVWDAIHLCGDDTSGRLDLDALRRRVDACFAPDALAELMPAAPPDSLPGRTVEIAREWMARGGKRWRPFLAACAHAAFTQEPDAPLAEALAAVAVAVECFHKASLIHDDIEDADDVRYGRQTLHREHGVPVALNVGDYLLGEGYRLLAEADVPAERKAAMLHAAAAGHRNLCLGQGEELDWMRRPRPLSPAQVVAIFRHKTAPAFEVALRLGAILAGADDTVREVIAHYSQFLGIAYQIRDDLDDFDLAPDAPPGDAHALRPSLLLAVAHELSQGDDRALLDRLWRRQCELAEVAGPLAELFDRLQVRDTVHQLLESYKAEAIRALAPLDNGHLKALLRRVISRIFNEAELKGWCGDFEHDDADGRAAGADSAA